MIKLWTDRALSFCRLFFSDRFKSPEGIVRQTQRRYSEAAEIEFYSRSENWNFLPEEKEVLELIDLQGGDVLVVGCGAGREFSLLRQSRFCGVDDCLPLLEKCRLNYPSATLAADLSELSHHRFDSIFVSYHVYNHIQGKDSRLGFLKQLSSLIRDNGNIYMFIDVFDLREGNRYRLASWMLKLLWSVTTIRWEAGDTLRKYNGNHNPDGGLFFYHYFKNENVINDELTASGLKVQKRPPYWMLAKS